LTIQKIIHLAELAGKMLMKYYKQDMTVQSKSQERFNPVTQADIEVDAFIRSTLQKEFPHDLILSEESKDIPTKFSGRVWMVDPLDGTQQFIRQREGFSVIIGLSINGIPSQGVVYAPVREELYYAEKGKGAYVVKDGKKQRIQVSNQNLFPHAMLVMKEVGTPAQPFNSFTEKLKLKIMKTDTCFALKCMSIATGEADLYIHPFFTLSKWDTCGSECILREAGGRITDLWGKELDYTQRSLSWKDSVVLSNGKLQLEIVHRIKASGLFSKSVSK